MEKCSYPLFQDLEEVDLWGLMDGGKDDFYIYDTDGILARYYAWGTEPALNLSTEEGYAALLYRRHLPAGHAGGIGIRLQCPGEL